MFSDSNEFAEDDSENYHFQFLKTAKTPNNSTQNQIYKKPHLYHKQSYEASQSEFPTPTAKFGATHTITPTSIGAYNSDVSRKRTYSGEISASQFEISTPKLTKFVYKSAPTITNIRATSITPTNNASDVISKINKFPAAPYTIIASSVGECNSVARRMAYSDEASTSQFEISKAKLPNYKPAPTTMNIKTASVDQPEYIESDSTNKHFVVNESATSKCDMVYTKCLNNEKLILANTALLNVLLKEVKYLRREQQHRLTDQSGNRDDNLPNLHLPAGTAENFKGIEHQIKAEEYEMALAKVFKHINEPNLDKFVRECLKSVITDTAATNFSWFGKNNNIPVKSFSLMNIIKETTIQRFPSVHTYEIVNIIKNGFTMRRTECVRQICIKINKVIMKSINV